MSERTTRSSTRWRHEMMSSPRSYYDALHLCTRLQESLKAVARAEIHLFGYLASLLAAYRGQLPSDWGYGFAITPDGYPFSHDVDASLDLLVRRGRLVADEDGYLMASPYGSMELEALGALSALRQNNTFVEGACGAALVMPVGIIRDALGREWDLQRVPGVSRAEILPTQVGSAMRRQHFAALRTALPSDPGDLMVPAVVWLSYLSESSSQGRSSRG